MNVPSIPNVSPLVSLAIALGLVVPTTWAYTRDRGEHERALRSLKERLKDSPNDAAILREIGERLTLWMSNDEDERTEVPLATFYLEKAQEAAPTDPLPVAWMGILTMVQAKSASLFDKKDIAKEGMSILDQAVAMDPSHPKVRMMRGSISVKLPDSFGRYEQALEDLEFVKNALERDPTQARSLNISLCVLHLNLGKAHRHLEDLEKARESWEVAVRYESGRPENSEAERLLEQTLASRSSGWDRYMSWTRGR